MSKAFVSSIFLGLVVLALVFLGASLNVKQSGFENAVLKARLVSERFDDSRDFLNSTLNDAIVDSAFASFGCTLVPPENFCGDLNSRYPLYLQNSLSALNSLEQPEVETGFSSSFSCNDLAPPFQVEENGVLGVSDSANKFLKNESLNWVKSVRITQTTKSSGSPPVTSVDRFTVEIQGELLLDYACP